MFGESPEKTRCLDRTPPKFMQSASCLGRKDMKWICTWFQDATGQIQGFLHFRAPEAVLGFCGFTSAIEIAIGFSQSTL